MPSTMNQWCGCMYHGLPMHLSAPASLLWLSLNYAHACWVCVACMSVRARLQAHLKPDCSSMTRHPAGTTVFRQSPTSITCFKHTQLCAVNSYIKHKSLSFISNINMDTVSLEIDLLQVYKLLFKGKIASIHIQHSYHENKFSRGFCSHFIDLYKLQVLAPISYLLHMHGGYLFKHCL